MPAVRVAECETAADVYRLARESAARRKKWSQPKQEAPKPPPPPPPPPPPKEPNPEIVPPESTKTAMLWLGRSATAIWVEMMAGRRQMEKNQDLYPYPAMDEIIRAVARAYGFRSTDLKAARTDRCSSQARHVSMLLCKMLTLASYPAIGRVYGNRDHTTVLHGVRKLAWLAPQLEALHTLADPPAAWAVSAVRLHPLPTPDQMYERRPEPEA